MRGRWVVLALMTVCGVAPAEEQPWLQWGGSTRDFEVAGGELSEHWPSTGPAVLWKRSLGAGYSAILSDGKRVYTQYRDNDHELVIALDATTGRTLWEHRYAAPVFRDQVKDFGMGPNATPVISGSRICAVGFTSKLRCLNRDDGSLIWKRDLVQELDGKVQSFGYAASPLVHDGMVIVLVGGRRYGAAGFDLEDGSLRWSTEPLDFSYASPVRIRVKSEEQLAFMTPDEIVAVAMKDGRLRWRHPHENRYRNNCQGPWWDGGDLLFVSSQANAGSRTLQLSETDGRVSVREIARDEQMGIFHGTAVLEGRLVYASTGDALVAYDIRSGRTVWAERGYPEANVIRAGNKLLVLDEEGRLTLATPTSDGLQVHARHTILARPAWTVPTLVGTKLYLRNTRDVLAMDLAAP